MLLLRKGEGEGERYGECVCGPKQSRGKEKARESCPSVGLGNLTATHVYVRVVDLLQDGKMILKSRIERMGRHMTDLINTSEILGEQHKVTLPLRLSTHRM